MDTAIAALVDALSTSKRDQWFTLPGIGWLEAVPHEGYEARNPRTGEMVVVTPGRVLMFIGARELYATLFGQPLYPESLEGERARHRGAKSIPGADALARTILERLRVREPADLPGLGVFVVVEKPAYTVRNPQTLAEEVAPARSIVLFRTAEGLKTRFNYPANHSED